MSEGIDAERPVRDALRVATTVLTTQAFALDRLFFRSAVGALSHSSPRSLPDARKALKVQARCRATFNLLLALRAAAGAEKKFSNSNEGTIQTPKTPCTAKELPKQETASPASDRRVPRRGGARWTPERRAKQAAAVRTWQPWLKSTGPKTHEGKARSAGNALIHGRRSS